ncbi:nuclear transport factor 2 family protein [Marinifilum caeruleilacunae]|uniref:SnoaL-like domain-containing protein n=1 Tax=Marinifilum caeruleilacunae TaxID=2499076 RepID=A0ABX1WVR9_9BACT|nr:nuclear transport factor 2 family protein [Marinifilum caeruleilacunae]NOU60157.1 hypothetical protein [Marinifilum caeruleilacunae]
MKKENNKQVVIDFFEKFSAADAEAALSFLHDDVQWRAMGLKGELPISGTMDKDGIAELIVMVKSAIPKGLHLKPIAWTAEGNRVAAEYESYGVLNNGRVYNNPYHFLFEFTNGKISVIKEYMDTLHVKETFID